MSQARTPEQEIERLARKRAGAKLGWYIHALVFIAVNVMLVFIAAMAGRNWAIFPAAGWAVGLAIHGAVVFFVTGGAGLHERLVQQERNRLQLQRDAW
ncbi:MAG: 2TM domain-containing protein [Ramlibacter sp.]